MRQWNRAHNARVRQAGTGRGVRIVPCLLPIKSPWLNPIEPKWIHRLRASARWSSPTACSPRASWPSASAPPSPAPTNPISPSWKRSPDPALGVLNARKDEAGDEGHFVPFTEQDLDFLAILAGQVAIALENARLFAQIAQQAMVDGLTGLLNHATFQQRLESELERAARSHQQLALLEIDLDGFKLVNDTYGHPTGDKLLRLLADRAVLGSIRPYDVAARPGATSSR